MTASEERFDAALAEALPNDEEFGRARLLATAVFVSARCARGEGATDDALPSYMGELNKAIPRHALSGQHGERIRQAAVSVLRETLQGAAQR